MPVFPKIPEKFLKGLQLSAGAAACDDERRRAAVAAEPRQRGQDPHPAAAAVADDLRQGLFAQGFVFGALLVAKFDREVDFSLGREFGKHLALQAP